MPPRPKRPRNQDVLLRRGGSIKAPRFTSGGTVLRRDVTIPLIGVQAGALVGRVDTIIRLGVIPPPAPGSNEPAGMTTFCDLPFNAAQESPFAWSTWPAPISDPTSPHSPNNVLQATLNPGGWEGGPQMADAYSLDPGVDGGRLYMRVYVKFVESNFQHHYNGVKMFYPMSYTHGHVFGTYCAGPNYSTAPITGKLYPQSTVGWQVFDQNVQPTASISRGTWHKIEVLWTANTPGVANGKYRYWLDGVLLASHDDIGFFNAGEVPRWWVMRFMEYGGGGNDPTIAQTQHINYDGLYVSYGGPESNEPAGYSTIVDRGFDAENEDGMTRYYGDFSIVSDSTSPHSPNNVGRVGNGPGTYEGYGTILEGPNIYGHKDLYQRFYIKPQANWRCHNNSYKISYPYLAPSHNLIWCLWCDGPDYTTAPIVSRLYPQSTVGAQSFSQNIRTDPIERNEWNKVELLYELGTPGVANGRYRYWLNGVLQADHTDVGFVNAGDPAEWALYRWLPYAGGGADPVNLASVQYLYVDGLYVSGKVI